MALSAKVSTARLYPLHPVHFSHQAGAEFRLRCFTTFSMTRVPWWEVAKMQIEPFHNTEASREPGKDSAPASEGRSYGRLIRSDSDI